MKKIIKLCLLFLGILIIVTAVISVTAIFSKEKPVTEGTETAFDRGPLDKASFFGDYVFEEKVRTLLKLGKEDKIDEAALSEIKELDLSSNASGISTDKTVLSLEGLKYFPSLNRLLIDKNRVESLEPLKNCPSLVSLSAKDCDLSDDEVTLLSDFQGLVYLNLSGNTISDLSFLKPLRNLRILNLGQNDFSDGKIFEEVVFKDLTELYINTTDVEDISSICENQTSLTLLDISGLQIYDKDIEPLKNLTNLTTLLCDANNIKESNVFSSLPKLEKLSLSENRIVSLKPFTDCKALTELDLSFNLLTSFDGIEKMENLRVFNGEKNKITSYVALESAPWLQVVKADDPNYCKGE